MTELEKAMKETAEAAIGMLKKSQMSLDFSAPNPHQVAPPKIEIREEDTDRYRTIRSGKQAGQTVSDKQYAVYKNGERLGATTTRAKAQEFIDNGFRYTKPAPNPHDHHKEYTRVNQSGTVSHIKAKGVQVAHQSGNKTAKLIKRLKAADFSKKTDIWQAADLTRSEGEDAVKAMILDLPPGGYKLHDREYGTNIADTIYNEYGWMPSMLVSESLLLGLQVAHPDKVYASFTLGLDAIEIKSPKPIWDSKAAVNDTKDIKRRLVAAGFKANEWSVRAGTVTSGPRKGEIDDAKISNRYPLQHADVVARTQALLDAGFDVTWNTMVRESGQRLTVPTVYSVPRQGKVTILDADKPVGDRLTTYSTQAEAEAALNHSTN